MWSACAPRLAPKIVRDFSYLTGETSYRTDNNYFWSLRERDGFTVEVNLLRTQDVMGRAVYKVRVEITSQPQHNLVPREGESLIIVADETVIRLGTLSPTEVLRYYLEGQPLNACKETVEYAITPNQIRILGRVNSLQVRLVGQEQSIYRQAGLENIALFAEFARKHCPPLDTEATQR